LLGAPRPQRQHQFRDRRDHKDKPDSRETRGSQETPDSREIGAGRGIPVMRAAQEILGRRDDPAIRAGKAEKAGTRRARLENIATPTPTREELAASETNNLTG
jgi:hypothetical protein